MLANAGIPFRRSACGIRQRFATQWDPRVREDDVLEAWAIATGLGRALAGNTASDCRSYLNGAVAHPLN
jgi:hypothetical protein